MVETKKKIVAKGAGRKSLTAEEKKAHQEQRELDKAKEILQKHGLTTVSVESARPALPDPVPAPGNVTAYPKKTRNRLPGDAYNYRYVMNTCQVGAIHIGDIGVFVEVDEEFKKVVRFTEEDFLKSRELGTHLAKGNLIEVTSEYLNFLENGNSVQDWQLWFRPNKVRMESTNFYPYRPKVRRDMVGQNDSPIVDEDDISRVTGTSDQLAHMASAKQNFRQGADIESIEEVLDAVSANNNPIADENVFDRSNPASFVDPRMTSAKRMPKTPEVHTMRSGQTVLTNEKEIYPYTDDHHERAMIASNSQSYVHVPRNVHAEMPITEDYSRINPPGFQDRIQTISQQDAQALYQQKMQQSQPQQQPQGPRISKSAQDMLNRS